MRKVTVIATAAAAAAALAVANLATATTTTKMESFTAITTDPGSGVASLIATGGFTAGGTDVIAGKKQTFRFAGGKFTLALVAKGSKHQSLNLATCLYTKTGSASYTLAPGTGVYKGITGSGKVSFTLRAVFPLVKGKCPPNDLPGGNGSPSAIQFTETASGPVSLP